MRALPALVVVCSLALAPLGCRGSEEDGAHAAPVDHPATPGQEPGSADGTVASGGQQGGAEAGGLDAGESLPADGSEDGSVGAEAGGGQTRAADAASSLGEASLEAGSISSEGGTSSGGTPAVPAGKVPVFVAVGHMGRTTLSCDDGRSWTHDRSLDDGARCFENGLDCDHTKGAGRGLDYGNGYFVAAFGWGEPGQLKRSRDGVSWEVAKDKTIFAGVAFGHGVFVANATRPLISRDALAWHDAKSELGLNVGNTRGIDWLAPGGGRFLVTGESETTDMVQSKDDGETWSHVGAPPKECGAWTRGAAANATTVVLASGKGAVCTSSDGGDSWELVQLDADGLTGPVLWTGSEFMTWNRSDVHRSKDGKVWAKQPTSPANIAIGPVARAPNGTFVAANDGWLSWYEKQQFFRSADGVRWEVLDKSKFKGSHPITFLRFGYADAATMSCP